MNKKDTRKRGYKNKTNVSIHYPCIWIPYPPNDPLFIITWLVWLNHNTQKVANLPITKRGDRLKPQHLGWPATTISTWFLLLPYVNYMEWRESYCGDRMILWSSYLHNGISYTGRMTSLYWIRPKINTMAMYNSCLINQYPPSSPKYHVLGLRPHLR